MKRYTVRKLPRLVGMTRSGAFDYGLFDPEGQLLARSYATHQLRLRRDDLQDAYELGYVTAKLEKRGRPPKVSPSGEVWRSVVDRMKEVP